jgi:hypothetical protein
MPDTIKTGTILIKEGTLLPEVLRFESEPCARGWRLVKNFDGYGLRRKIHEAGWTFSWRAGEIGATIFGLDEQKTLRRAVEQILANLESAEFNSLQIMRVASEASKRFRGVHYVTVSAQSRHIQQDIGLVPARDFVLRMPAAAPESRLGSRGEQHHGEVATKQNLALISSS